MKSAFAIGDPYNGQGARVLDDRKQEWQNNVEARLLSVRLSAPMRGDVLHDSRFTCIRPNEHRHVRMQLVVISPKPDGIPGKKLPLHIRAKQFERRSQSLWRRLAHGGRNIDEKKKPVFNRLGRGLRAARQQPDAKEPRQPRAQPDCFYWIRVHLSKKFGDYSRSIGILACAPLSGERQRDANFSF